MASFSSGSFSIISFSHISFFVDEIIDIVAARDDSGIYGKLKKLQALIRQYEIVNEHIISVKDKSIGDETETREFKSILFYPFSREITPQTEIVKLSNGSFTFTDNKLSIQNDNSVQSELLAELTTELLSNLNKPIAVNALKKKAVQSANQDESDTDLQMILNILMMID